MLTDEQISEIESASEFYIDECEHTISELCADWRALQAQVATLQKQVSELQFENELLKARCQTEPTVTGSNFTIPNENIVHYCAQCQKWHPIGMHDTGVKIICTGDTL